MVQKLLARLLLDPTYPAKIIPEQLGALYAISMEVVVQSHHLALIVLFLLFRDNI